MDTPGVEAPSLGRAERLRGRADFQRIFGRGSRVERPGFVLLWQTAAGRRQAAFTASRRLGGSVRRNRARRRLREAYRQAKGLLPVRGIQVCFVARAAAADLPFCELAAGVAVALRQAAQRVGS